MWSGGLQFSTLVKSSLVKTGGIRTGREGLHLMASAGASSGWNGTVLNGAAALWKVHAAPTLVQIGYAGATVLQKATFNAGTNVIVFSVYRDIVSFSCLVPMAYLSERGRRVPLEWKTLSLIVLSGFIGMYAAQLALIYGIALARPSYGALIGITGPIFAFIISAVSGLEEIDWKKRGWQAKIVGVLSAVCGGALIPLYNGPEILPSLRSVHSVPLSQVQQGFHGVLAPTLKTFGVEDWQFGAFLLIVCGALFAVYWTLQAYVIKRYPAPVSTAAIAYTAGARMLTVTGFLTIQDLSEWKISLQPMNIIPILYVGLISSGVNFALQSWALFERGPVLLSAYTPLQSCTSITIAYVFVGDSIHLGSIVGLLAIVNGIYLITWGQVASRKKAGHLVKTLPSPLDGNIIIKGDSNLEQHLLGQVLEPIVMLYIFHHVFVILGQVVSKNDLKAGWR